MFVCVCVCVCMCVCVCVCVCVSVQCVCLSVCLSLWLSVCLYVPERFLVCLCYYVNSSIDSCRLIVLPTSWYGFFLSLSYSLSNFILYVGLWHTVHVWFTPNLFSFSVYVLTTSFSFVVLLCTVNVATGKTYSQISKYYSQGPSSNAANGDTGGVYSSSNCIHTKVYGSYPYFDANPWWEVNLGRTYPVYTIKVWARNECELYSFLLLLLLLLLSPTSDEKEQVPVSTCRALSYVLDDTWLAVSQWFTH